MHRCPQFLDMSTVYRDRPITIINNASFQHCQMCLLPPPPPPPPPFFFLLCSSLCPRGFTLLCLYMRGSRNGAIGGGGGGGGAVGWRGCRGRGPPTHQQGGMGERCKLPHRGLGRSPRSFHIFRFKAAKNQRIRSAVKEFTYARKTTKFIATTRLVTVVNRRLSV